MLISSSGCIVSRSIDLTPANTPLASSTSRDNHNDSIVSQAQASSQKRAPANETLVFGRVAGTHSEEPTQDWRPPPGTKTSLCITEVSFPDCLESRVTGDGYFCWHLKPGRYAIAGYVWGTSLNYKWGRIWAEFDVPAGTTAHYIGTLHIRLDEGSDGMSVTDDRPEAEQWFTSAFPSAQVDPDTHLMVLEQPL
jgi:hypothetical protein